MGGATGQAAAASMTTADWAFVVSLFSAAVSLFSLGWNVYSKWVHPKPKIRVSFAVMYLFDGNGMSEPFLGATATNFGPTDTTLKSFIAKSRQPGWWWKVGHYRRWQYGMMNHVSTPHQVLHGTASDSPMPHKLAVGGEMSVYVTFKYEHLRDDGIVDVGFSDIFGRNHWAPRKSVRGVVKSIRKDFPKPKDAA